MVNSVGTLTLQSTVTRAAPRDVIVTPDKLIKGSHSGFVSSIIRVDNLQNVAILEYRSESGDVVQQYPTQAQIEAFKSAERLLTGRQQETEVAVKYAGDSGEHVTDTPIIATAPLVRTPVESTAGSSPSGTEHSTYSVLA